MKTNLFKMGSSNNFMKSLSVLTFLTVLVFCFGFSSAVSYNATNGTNIINSCGEIISPGAYVLANDLGFSGFYCLKVNASDVFVSGSGYKIYNGSNFGMGILNYGSNLSLHNLSIDSVMTSLFFMGGVENNSLNSINFMGNTNLINNESSVIYSLYNVSYYFDATFFDHIGSKLNNSNITLINTNTGDQTIVLSDENGTTPTQTLLGYVNNNGNLTNYSYYASAIVNGFLITSDIFDITSNMDVNVTLNDTVAPSVVLNSPSDGASYTSNSQNVEFNFSADDLSNFSCVLYVEGNNYTNFTVNGSEYFVSDSFIPGSYSWYVNCTDSADNSNITSNRSFTVSAPVVAATGGGGDGGGWAAPNEPIIVNSLEGGEGDGQEEEEPEEEVQTGLLTGGVIAPITGAAVGTLGETGTLILGVFATVLLIVAGVVVFKKAEWKRKGKKSKK